jgi:hypothetical protein
LTAMCIEFMTHSFKRNTMNFTKSHCEIINA